GWGPTRASPTAPGQAAERGPAHPLQARESIRARAPWLDRAARLRERPGSGRRPGVREEAMKNESHAELSTALWPDAKQVPSKVRACRHCGRKNRVQVPRAVLEPRKCECGVCGKPLFLSTQEPLTGIASSAYEHTLDRTTLAALKAI